MTRRKSELSKSDHIRDILKARGRCGIYEIREQLENRLRQVVGRAVLYQLLAAMKKSGEIDTDGRGDDTVYFLKEKR